MKTQRIRHISLLIKSKQFSRADQLLKISKLNGQTSKTLITIIHHAKKLHAQQIQKDKVLSETKAAIINHRRLQGAVKLSDWSKG